MRTLRHGKKKAAAFVGVVAALGLAGGIIGPVGAAPEKGQLKIDGPSFDTTTNNEPHARCVAGPDASGTWSIEAVRLLFFKYKDDAKVDVSFDTMNPTDFGHLGDMTGVSAGGNPGYTGDLSTNLNFWLKNSPEVVKHHGMVHVRITATSPDGSSSQKVVWVDPCPDWFGTN